MLIALSQDIAGRKYQGFSPNRERTGSAFKPISKPLVPCGDRRETAIAVGKTLTIEALFSAVMGKA
jgi:hypothetical protein